VRYSESGDRDSATETPVAANLSVCAMANTNEERRTKDDHILADTDSTRVKKLLECDEMGDRFLMAVPVLPRLKKTRQPFHARRFHSHALEDSTTSLHQAHPGRCRRLQCRKVYAGSRPDRGSILRELSAHILNNCGNRSTCTKRWSKDRLLQRVKRTTHPTADANNCVELRQ
jgi:hypothetical protein